MKHLFLFCLLTICLFATQGQTPAPALDMIAAPSSPAAASLSRYVDFPVTMSSGVPNISIPLYEFKSSRITVPISLSYHAGGIRVTDRTSTMGLGWTLIAGGAITRSIIGVPDEEPRGFFHMDYPDNLSEAYSGFFYDRNGDNAFRQISCFVNRVNNTGANSGYNEDSSPDNFYYNAQGLSGQFSYGTDQLLHTIPYDPVRIQNNLKSNQVTEKAPFIITAPDGVTYEFGKPLVNGKTPATDYISIDNSPDYASAWYLTKIVSADKSDTVIFHYSTDYDSYWNATVGSSMRAGYHGYSFNFYTRLQAEVSKSQSNSTEYNVRLTDITGKNGRVHFNYGEDLVNSYHYGNTTVLFTSTIRPLSSIEIYANAGSEVKVRQFDFQQSFFNSVPVSAANSLRLDGVTETGFLQGSPQSNPPYVFSYATSDVPPFNTNSRDLWGYYNGYRSYGDNDNMLLVDLPVPLMDENGHYREPKDNFQKRAVNPAVLNMGMLKSISYPTGGYSEFTFEPNGKSKSVMVEVPQRNSQMIRTMDFWPGSGTGGIDKTFTLGSTGFNRKLEFYGRLVTSGQNYLENDPQIILEDITASETIIDKTLSALASGAKTAESYSISLPDLNPAHTYRLYFPMPSNQILSGQSVRYELHAFFNEDLPSIFSTQEQFIYAGGLRIKSIEHRDNFTSGFIKKAYNYTESYWNSNVFSGDFNTIKHAFGKQLFVQPPRPNGDTTLVYRPAGYIYQESPSYSIGSPSSSVSYSKVEEVQVTDDDKFVGKTEYTFNTGIDEVTIGIDRGINWRQAVKIDRSFVRSQLLNKKVYKSQGNDWVLIQETQNTYDNINDLPYDVKGSEYIKKYITAYLHDDALYAVWAEHPLYPLLAIDDTLCTLYPRAIAISFNTMYLNIVRPTLIATKTKELGTSGNWIENQTNYEYLNLSHMKPGEIITRKSDGSTVKQQIKYSTDVDIPYEGQGNAGSHTPIEIPANHPVFSGIINLQLANITAPIETTTFIKHDGSEVELLLGSAFNYYNPLLPVIDSVAAIEVSVPDDQFAGANIFASPIDYHTDNLILDARYTTKADFKYNAKGSLVQQHKANNLYETFLWGYNEQYPVAHIAGAKYDVAKDVISASYLANTQSFSDNGIRTELNKLRTDAFLSSALVTTYTVAPLQGMTSQTDPAGKTSYYEYDAFSRLSVVRDQFSHIIKKYAYNYNSDKQIFTFVNRSQWGSFTKTGCPSQYYGSSVAYKVPGGKYYSTISQEDADLKAAAEISALGQAYANDHGTCTQVPPPLVYFNKAMSMAFEKDDCPGGMVPVEDPVIYTVNAGQFSSLISEADAEQQAMDNLYTSGQAYANSHCSCSSAPVTIELKSGTDVDAYLIVMDLNEEELYQIFFPVNSSANPETIELPPTKDGYLLRFVVPLDPPYTDPYSNGPYRFHLQSEGLIWRSNYYNGSSNTTIWTQTDRLVLRPGRTYSIKADQTWN